MNSWMLMGAAVVFYILSFVVKNDAVSTILMSLAVGSWLTFAFYSLVDLFWTMKESEKSAKEWEKKWKQWKLESAVREEVSRQMKYHQSRMEMEVRHEVAKRMMDKTVNS